MFIKSRICLYCLAGAIFTGSIFLFVNTEAQYLGPHPHLTLNEKTISLTILDTSAAREKGLSGKRSLAEDAGFLFIFQTPERYAFWMKDMKFPIDIIWLDERYRIVHIEDNVSPDTFPQSFVPAEKSLYVLETNASFAQKNSLKIGDKLSIFLQ